MVILHQLSKRDSVRSTLAAVVLLQLKFSRPFTNVISFKVFYDIQPWIFHFLSNVNIQAKSHFAIFQVLLFLCCAACCFQFLCTEYGTIWTSVLFNLHFVCTIRTLINLNNFKNIPPKSVCVHRLIKITSYEISFLSQHAEINGNR